MGSSSDPFERRGTLVLRIIYVLVVLGLMLVLGRSTEAWGIPVVAIVLYAIWRKWGTPRLDAWNDGQNEKYRRERLEREAAHARIAALDAALDAERKPYIPRMAFDAETQRANGMPMYHTSYISPEQQRYLEEWFPDEDGLPSLKAGVYVTPIRVTGPELIDAPPPERPFFIPVKRIEPRRYTD
jgi:hypothetical protein